MIIPISDYLRSLYRKTSDEEDWKETGYGDKSEENLIKLEKYSKEIPQQIKNPVFRKTASLIDEVIGRAIKSGEAKNIDEAYRNFLSSISDKEKRSLVDMFFTKGAPEFPLGKVSKIIYETREAVNEELGRLIEKQDKE